MNSRNSKLTCRISRRSKNNITLVCSKKVSIAGKKDLFGSSKTSGSLMRMFK